MHKYTHTKQNYRRSKSESLVNASTNLVKVICQQLGERLHVSKATLQPVFTPLTPAELCMLVMGLSWLKLQPAPGLLDAIARDAVSRIGDFNAQGMVGGDGEWGWWG